MVLPGYCSREDVARALDVKSPARSSRRIDRAVQSARDAVEGLLHRRFYPELATRYFNWPDRSYQTPWRLWLDQHELISVTTLVAGGITIPASDYFLEPNSGPPFTRLEIDLESNSAFSTGPTSQRDIAITGLYGYRADTEPAGALNGSLNNSQTNVGVTDSSLIGVGDLIQVESERMVVTEKSMVDTTQNTSALTASNADVAITGVTGGSIAVDEVILIDSERMLVVDVAGTTLTVKRAYDGSVLATHSGATDIFAPRTLTVERGSLGTTAAAHNTALAILRHKVPSLIRTLGTAEAINTLLQETSGYARVVGSGDNQMEATGKGLKDLRDDAFTRYGRKARSRSV